MRSMYSVLYSFLERIFILGLGKDPSSYSSVDLDTFIENEVDTFESTIWKSFVEEEKKKWKSRSTKGTMYYYPTEDVYYGNDYTTMILDLVYSDPVEVLPNESIAPEGKIVVLLKYKHLNFQAAYDDLRRIADGFEPDISNFEAIETEISATHAKFFASAEDNDQYVIPVMKLFQQYAPKSLLSTFYKVQGTKLSSFIPKLTDEELKHFIGIFSKESYDSAKKAMDDMEGTISDIIYAEFQEINDFDFLPWHNDEYTDACYVFLDKDKYPNVITVEDAKEVLVNMEYNHFCSLVNFGEYGYYYE
jgi:hypothetical protein